MYVDMFWSNFRRNRGVAAQRVSVHSAVVGSIPIWGK